MSFKKEILKTKLHAASSFTQQTSAEDIKKEILARQAEIDEWNNKEVYVISDEVKNLQMLGSSVVVKLFKEDYIKSVTMVGDTELYDAYIGQVEIQRIGQNKHDFIENPLPYVFSGVVHAISPEVQALYAKKEAEMKEAGIEFIPLKVGSKVNLEWHDRQRDRFYPNKQKIDLIKNPQEFNIDNYEGLVKVHYSIIESIIK
jgi:hypothetical protein